IMATAVPIEEVPMFRNGMQPSHLIVLLVIVALLFGANRLPGLAKSVGQSLKIFKSEIQDLTEDSGKTTSDTTAAATAAQSAVAQSATATPAADSKLATSPTGPQP